MKSGSQGFDIVKRMGTGNLGDVFLARARGESDPDALRVVKVLNPYLFEGAQIDPAWLEEVQAINARLDHPKIVAIDDIGMLDGQYYLSTTYVRGETVESILKRARTTGEQLPVAAALLIASEIAASLEYAHGVTSESLPGGIVHASITPRSIFIGYEDGTVYLTDFGVDRLKSMMGRASTGSVQGKYAYMAPEQIADAVVLPRSDLFSLGTVLYEMLTQKNCFQRRSEFETVRAISECLVPPPSHQNPAVNAELDAQIARAMARLPSDRFADAKCMRLALEECRRSVAPSTAADLARLARNF